MNDNLINHLKQIAHLFGKNKDQWRSRAFSKVADEITVMGKPVVVEDGILVSKIRGVGDAISDVIVQFLATGTSQKYEKLRALLPNEVVERFDAPVCRRTVTRLLQPLTAATIDWEFAGSMRRGSKTVKDVDVIVCLHHESPTDTRERDLVLKCILDAGLEPDVRNGKEKIGMSVPIKSQGRSFTLDLNFTFPEHRGAHYLYFTGPKSFNIEQRARAKAKGLTLNQRGLYNNDVLIASRTEEDIFAALGEQYIEPALRA